MADGNSGKTGFMWKAMMLLSAMTSGIATFLLTALIYNSTSEWVKDYAVENYGAWTETLMAFLWFIASAFMIFAFFNLLILGMIWIIYTYLMSRGFTQN